MKIRKTGNIEEVEIKTDFLVYELSEKKILQMIRDNEFLEMVLQTLLLPQYEHESFTRDHIIEMAKDYVKELWQDELDKLKHIESMLKDLE